MKLVMISKRFVAASFVVLLGLIAVPSQATVVRLVDSSGVLTGATGVEVDGATYDVNFRDGSCIELLDGCESNTPFIFRGGFTPNYDAVFVPAYLAAQALLDQVFLDVPGGNFDSLPFFTQGCSDASECAVVTIVDSFHSAAWGVSAINAVSTAFDRTEKVQVNRHESSTSALGMTYAVWSKSASNNVPEPSILALLGFAGAALVWLQRRRRGSLDKRVA